MPDEHSLSDTRDDDAASRTTAGLEADVEGPTQAIVRNGGTIETTRSSGAGPLSPTWGRGCRCSR
jgi:hypothetical protein